MTTKKNLVKMMFMNILTAGTMFAFTACSDDSFESEVMSMVQKMIHITVLLTGVRIILRHRLRILRNW